MAMNGYCVPDRPDCTLAVRFAKAKTQQLPAGARERDSHRGGSWGKGKGKGDSHVSLSSHDAIRFIVTRFSSVKAKAEVKAGKDEAKVEEAAITTELLHSLHTFALVELC